MVERSGCIWAISVHSGYGLGSKRLGAVAQSVYSRLWIEILSCLVDRSGGHAEPVRVDVRRSEPRKTNAPQAQRSMANNGRVGIHYEPNTARYDTSDQTTVQYAYFCVDGVMLAKLRDFGLQTKPKAAQNGLYESYCTKFASLYLYCISPRCVLAVRRP